jgi:hypothetical protein
MEVNVYEVNLEDLKAKIQEEKDNGKRILALSPSKIIKGAVKTFVLITQ